ncbi:MAG TPA: hypothetical protein VEA17_22605 [Bordetella sp.]|nr:hypothetical protein [Bordetella sp.]
MMNRLFGSRFYSHFLLLFFSLMVAAASFNGFYTKWRLNDGHRSLGLSYMVEGTAARPYVYRQLVPSMANALQALLPPSTVARVSERLSEPRRVNSRSGLAMRYAASEALQPAVTLRYHIVYYLTFMALVASLYVMRRLCLVMGASRPAATAAPAILALLMPFLLTEGGYFYDYTEMLFMMGAVLLAAHTDTAAVVRVAALLLLSVLATWNKEAFFWFVPALYPLLRQRMARPSAAAATAALLLVCGCVYLAMRWRYAGNPGSTVDFQLWDSLRFYLDPGNWLRTESTYGVLLPRGFSIVTVLVIVGVAYQAWHRLSAAMRQHALAALAINVPLFVLFCSPGEMRNLSMLYPTFLVLAAQALTAALASAGAPPLKSRARSGF